jgi:2,3-bisphosphoglycerate-independent phosphoglycerate mutase
MFDYSADHIPTPEAAHIIKSLNQNLGGDAIKFYLGVGYRHILKIKGHEDTLKAKCTPPHDIPGKSVKDFLPQGSGADLLLDLMTRSEILLKSHKINEKRLKRGDVPVTTIWLFWGSGQVPAMPSFKQAYGLNAAMTSGVDLLNGLARMADMTILKIKGVTDAADSHHAAQAKGALEALNKHDLVVVHIEAPDEAGHSGHAAEKIKAIENIDHDVIAYLRNYSSDLRVLIMPDHPTPVTTQIHSPDPVPFLMWGRGISANGAARFTEAQAKATGVFIGDGYKIMDKLLGK